MLGSMHTRGDFEHIRDAQKCLLSVSIGHDLQYCEVFKDTVHHVLLRQMLQLVNEVDHVFTHW